MVGRYKKEYGSLWRPVEIQTENGTSFSLAIIEVRCPVCKSPIIGEYGTHERINSRVDVFQCKNPNCSHRKIFKQGKQFILTSSHLFQSLILKKLQGLFEDIIIDGAKHKTIAKKYNISEAQVSALRSEFEIALQNLDGLDSLVLTSQADIAIAIDETFLKIESTSIYIIIATGYSSRKVLSVKVSTSRSEEDIMEVFQEADANTSTPLEVVTSDGLNATQSMVKNVGREMTHVIHPHKKPFDQAIIRHYRYEHNERITTTIGVKTDFFKTRSKRRFRYMETRTTLTPKKKRKRGRPKGSKTNKKKKPPRPKKKRGRKGLYSVFTKGTIGYATIDPYRDKLEVKKGMSNAVDAALNTTLCLFSLMSIQNNLSENINALLRSMLRLTGPKTIESVEQRIRATVKIRNHPELLSEILIERKVRGEFLLNNLSVLEYAELCERGIFM